MQAGADELYLSQIELLKMMLAQERLVRMKLEIDLFEARWKEQHNAYIAENRKKTLQFEKIKVELKKVQQEVEERLSISLEKYAFDDETGRLNLIEE